MSAGSIVGASLVGGALALWGRIKASRKIG